MINDLLKALHNDRDAQCQTTDREEMTTAVTAALHFRVGLLKGRAQWNEVKGDT
jgi:hypothetical protein